MAYIPKIVAKEETLHGIARLHWIYVAKGIGWFFVLAGSGWLLDAMVGKALMTVASSLNSAALPGALLMITNVMMYFLMAGGFFIFLLYVMKVLFTEIGLSDRRVMHKTGMIFIKVQQVDLEEIRGENLDLGYFGRVLGYGYIMLDCRFIGDVRLPAIENPERFVRGLHTLRADTQDSLSVVVGKGNKKPLNIVSPEDSEGGAQPSMQQAQQPQQPPEIQPGQQPAQPEISPPPQKPEINPPPVPHNPPPNPDPAPQPEAPPAQPQQPIPAPPPTEPPLQTPTGGSVQMDPAAVTQLVKAVLPQMAEEVVKELTEKGMLNKPTPENDNKAEIDNDLAAVFDDAALEQNGKKPNDAGNKVEHSIH